MPNRITNNSYLSYCSQVFYRQEGHSKGQVIETQKPQAVVPLPESGVYIIEVRAYSEGGDGTASSPIRVPSYSGKWDIAGSLWCTSLMLEVLYLLDIEGRQNSENFEVFLLSEFHVILQSA